MPVGLLTIDASFSSSDICAPAVKTLAIRPWSLDLLARLTIRANEAPDRTCQADETAEASITPAAAIIELREDLVRWGVVGHDPEDNEEGEECEDVYEKDDAFQQRQVVGAEDVEAYD